MKTQLKTNISSNQSSWNPKLHSPNQASYHQTSTNQISTSIANIEFHTII